MDDKSTDRNRPKNQYLRHWGMEDKLEHEVLHFLVRRWHFVGLKDRAQPLDVPKTFQSAFKVPTNQTRDVRAVYPVDVQTIIPCARSMPISTQEGYNRSPPSHQKRHSEYCSQSRTRLKRRHFTTPVLSFVLHRVNVTVSLFAVCCSESSRCCKRPLYKWITGFL